MSAPYVLKKIDEFDAFKKGIEDGSSESPLGKKELVFSTYQSFPSIGESDVLYIDKTSKLMYYFDTDTLTYIALKSEASGPTINPDECFLSGDTLQCVL